MTAIEYILLYGTMMVSALVIGAIVGGAAFLIVHGIEVADELKKRRAP